MIVSLLSIYIYTLKRLQHISLDEWLYNGGTYQFIVLHFIAGVISTYIQIHIDIHNETNGNN